VYARLDLGKAAPFEMQSVSQGPFGFVSAILNWGKARGAERRTTGATWIEKKSVNFYKNWKN
jgi:hypothetical protein